MEGPVKRRSIMKNESFRKEFANTYDYVMIFKLEKDTKNQTSATRYVVNEMLEAGLELFSYLSVQEDELIVLIRAPIDKLKKFADEIDFSLELDPDYVQKKLEEGKKEKDPKTGKEVYRIKPAFISHDPKVSAIRPWDHIYGKFDEDLPSELYFSPPQEGTPFTKSIRLKLIYYLLKAPKRQGGCDLKLTKLIHKQHIVCMFPLHDKQISETILTNITATRTLPWTLPHYDFKEYFGEKIALYNVFIGHYSKWLVYPSGIGLIFQLVVWGTLNYSSPVLPFYSLIITIWSIYMLEYWKREEQMTAVRWGMTEFEQQEPDRPEFRGELIASYVDGKEMLYYPPPDIRKKLCASQTVILSFILLVIGVVASIYVIRFSLQNSIGAYASTVASILNTVQITLFNMIYSEIAIILTNEENHRTDTQYEDSMIVKLFAFQFINSYASFFFLAFIAQNLQKSNDAPTDDVGQCGFSNCMQPLSVNLAIIFGTRLTLTNFLDVFIPYVNYKNKIKAETEGVTNWEQKLTPAEKDYMLMTYDPLIEGIKNYADTAIQYGFSLLFITALPCANFFSLVSNYVKVKTNAWKLTRLYQRPIPSGAQDIGTWQPIFTFISVASVVTNAGLICFTMDGLSDYSNYGRLWIFVGFVTTLIAVQFFTQAVIPDVPEEVNIQLARMEFIKQKIIEDTPDEDADEYDPSGRVTKLPSDVATASGYLCFCFGGNHPTIKKEKDKFGNYAEVVVESYPVSDIAKNANPMHGK